MSRCRTKLFRYLTTKSPKTAWGLGAAQRGLRGILWACASSNHTADGCKSSMTGNRVQIYRSRQVGIEFRHFVYFDAFRSALKRYRRNATHCFRSLFCCAGDSYRFSLARCGVSSPTVASRVSHSRMVHQDADFKSYRADNCVPAFAASALCGRHASGAAGS